MDSNKQTTILAFQSTAFNTTTKKDYFINPNCFGDDVARWLIAELRINGYDADETPGQEDFGWYVRFEIRGAKHDVVIGYRPNSHNGCDEWICWIERTAGLVGSLFGKRQQIAPEAVEAIRRILSVSPQIRELRLCSEKEL